MKIKIRFSIGRFLSLEFKIPVDLAISEGVHNREVSSHNLKNF